MSENKDKKSARIELTKKERKILDKLKIEFDKGSRNAVLRHLIRLANIKYIEE